MSPSRPIVALIGAGVLGIALVGAGAGAQFTTSVSGSQTIQAGTLHMSVWSPIATNGCTDSTKHCTSVTLPAVSPVGSTFVSPQQVIYVTNTGNIPATYADFQISVPAPTAGSASAYLLAQTNVCLTSTDSPSTPNHSSWVEGNGPLLTAISLHPSVGENSIVVNPNDTVRYGAIFYAGTDTATPAADRSGTYSEWPALLTGCGNVVSDGPSTMARWKNMTFTLFGYTGYQTPASLTNDAQGGSITPSVSLSFTG